MSEVAINRDTYDFVYRTCDHSTATQQPAVLTGFGTWQLLGRLFAVQMQVFNAMHDAQNMARVLAGARFLRHDQQHIRATV